MFHASKVGYLDGIRLWMTIVDEDHFHIDIHTTITVRYLCLRKHVR